MISICLSVAAHAKPVAARPIRQRAGSCGLHQSLLDCQLLPDVPDDQREDYLMTTIVFNGIGQDMNIPDLPGLFDYDFADVSTTVARFFDNAFDYVEFTGTGFKIDDQGVPTSGTITGAVVVEGGLTLQSYSNVSMLAAALYNYALNNDVSGFYAELLARADSITGSDFDDVLFGGRGNDTIKGGGGADRILGQAGKDRLDGDAGNDTLLGGAADDRLNGGDGADTMTGNAGADSFYFTSALGTGVDRITDFEAGVDFLHLSRTVFAGIGAKGNPMTADRFVTSVSGIPALDANDRIIYEFSTGRLYYDSDGSGANAAVLFARLTSLPALTAADIFVA